MASFSLVLKLSQPVTFREPPIAGPCQRRVTQSKALEMVWRGLSKLSFCDRMVPRFPENEGMFGLVTFVSCTEIKAAISRAFVTWAANHPLISFVDITNAGACSSGATGELDDPCPWELLIGTGAGDNYPTLAAYVINYRASQFDTLWCHSPNSPAVSCMPISPHSQSSLNPIAEHFAASTQFCCPQATLFSTLRSLDVDTDRSGLAL